MANDSLIRRIDLHGNVDLTNFHADIHDYEGFEKDNSLFDYSRMPNVEEDEEEISDEEAEEIIQGIKESREEIIEDRTKLDDLLATFTSDLKDIPDYKFDIDEL